MRTGERTGLHVAAKITKEMCKKNEAKNKSIGTRAQPPTSSQLSPSPHKKGAEDKLLQQIRALLHNALKFFSYLKKERKRKIKVKKIDI